MSSLLYWILFTVLLGLIIVFLGYIIASIIIDKCFTNSAEKMNKTSDSNEECRLSKYLFDKSDVEDLTRIEGDFKKISPKVTYVNEVDNSSVDDLLKRTEHRRLHPMGEGGSEHSIDDLHSSTSVYTITEERDEFLDKGISKSVDDLEFCDPKAIDILREIERIKEEAVKVERELKYFIGGTNDVKYYEMNEKFLKLMIALCEVFCESDELRRKKSEVLEYIEGCQKRLKEKVNK